MIYIYIFSISYKVYAFIKNAEVSPIIPYIGDMRGFDDLIWHLL